MSIVAENRQARHNYSIEETFEAGMVLLGTEVKALRAGKAQLRDAYCIFKSGELFLINSHIAAYDLGNRFNHEPTRTRKLLMHRSELNKLWGRGEMRGYNLIPLKIYFKKGTAKVEIALCRSKKSYDKRADIKEKENKRALDRAMKSKRR